MTELEVLIIVLGIIVIIVALFFASYVKVKPNDAYIITGPKRARVVTGKATFRIPFFERIDIVPLDIMQVDIKTTSAVPTNEFINIFVDGVANVKTRHNEESIKLAGELFLKLGPEKIKAMAQEILEGNMREIIGQMKLTELVQNRDIFADNVSKSATKDMERMGLEIVNLTIQNFMDENNVIQDLGIDNIEQIRKGANIARAEAKRDVAVATSAAEEKANQARISAELLIAEQNTNLELKKADLKQRAETQKAYADAAYEIRQATEKKKINVANQEAAIAMKEKEIELKEKEVIVEERSLEALIMKKAEANRYAVEQQSDAALYKRTKEADAKLAEETRQAKAIQITAEAEKEAALAKALGIEAVGKAEAEAILAKAEAMKQMENAAVLGLILDSKVFPDMVAAAAKPMEQIDSIVMLGENQTSKLAGGVMNTVTQVTEGLKASGIDLMSILSGALGGAVATKVIDNKDTPE